MPEFTGERVVPGEVDADLWNEHFSRYVFASRLCRGKRVLDIACGTGYGAAQLAQQATSVVGIDVAPTAVAYAKATFSRPNTRHLCASATALPFPDSSFDLITAFEVIEHLDDWPQLLTEAARLLSPGGQFVVSTPNKTYYTETRRLSGPNPFHAHEFTFDEFRDALQQSFPSVAMFVQNHSQTVVFEPLDRRSGIDVRREETQADPAAAHFFVAVCARASQTGAPTFLYLPTSGNLLREREHHISRLESELVQKNDWLATAQHDHQALLEKHREQKAELEQRNEWAAQLNSQLSDSQNRVAQLQDELAAEQSSARETVAQYEASLAAMHDDLVARTQWAQDTETRLTTELEARTAQLVASARLLQEAEKTVEERTLWAQSLETERVRLDAVRAAAAASRWHRLGRKLGLGPEIPES